MVEVVVVMVMVVARRRNQHHHHHHHHTEIMSHHLTAHIAHNPHAARYSTCAPMYCESPEFLKATFNYKHLAR